VAGPNILLKVKSRTYVRAYSGVPLLVGLTRCVKSAAPHHRTKPHGLTGRARAWERLHSGRDLVSKGHVTREAGPTILF
jgi:hypothetical protein